MINALTIDVEDYFMVSAFSDVVRFEDWGSYESRVVKPTMKILDLLDTHGVKATFFVLGWIAERHKGLVVEIQRRGHEIASHGYNHRLAYDLSRDEFREDTRKAKGLLEDITGEAVAGYRAASYSITKRSLWALDVLIEEGFAYDSSIFPIYHDRYGYPEFSRFPEMVRRDGIGEILEIPLTSVKIFGKNFPVAGGGYLRLLPLRFIQWSIRKINDSESHPAVIYFHPWEVDAEQPKVNSGMISSFRHRINIDKTYSKINRLLETLKFGTIKEVFAHELGEKK